MTRVVIAAPSDVARAGIFALVSQMDDVAIVGRATEPDELTDIARRIAPDVVLLDTGGDGGGSDQWLGALGDGPQVRGVVLLSDDAPDAAPFARHGITAYATLPARAGSVEIDAAIRAVAAGLIVTHPSLAERHLQPVGTRTSQDGSVLTPREIEVLGMLAAGLPNKTIAKKLGVSAHTVKFHVGSIMTKLHASSRTEAVTDGIRRGLIFL